MDCRSRRNKSLRHGRDRRRASRRFSRCLGRLACAPAHAPDCGLLLREAEDAKISGRDLTPFLLARMAELSEGATLRANIALLENNAGVAARIANALSSNN